MFKITPATTLRFNSHSRDGYVYEKYITAKYIKHFGGREATQAEQNRGIDYVSGTGTRIEIKHQPRAKEIGTINVEILEVNSKNRSDFINGHWLRCDAEILHWCIKDDDTEEVIIFHKAALDPYIQRAIAGEIIVGFNITSNGERAKNESRGHGSSKYDDAVTCRVDIHILKQIEKEYEHLQAGIQW